MGTRLRPPWAALAERVCLVARQPDGWALQSDVTTSPDSAWRAGGVSRMIASLVRAARATGEAELFGANGPALWTRVRRHLEALLIAYWQEGGLGGATPDEAFEVRCDRSTMTQNDLDSGRLVARITVLPVAAIERITVVLALSAAGQRRRRSQRGGVMAEPQTPDLPENQLAPFHVFRFQVSFTRANLPGAQAKPASDVPLCSGAFAECTGLEATMEPKVIKAGGANYGPAQRVGPGRRSPPWCSSAA